MEVPAGSPVPTGPAPAAHAPGGVPLPSRRVLVLLTGAFGLAILFWFGRDVLAPFVVGILVVYLLDPLVERLARIRVAGRRIPRAPLILLVYVVATVILVELVLLLIGPLVEQVQAFVRDAPGYVDDLNARLTELLGWWNRLDLPAEVKVAIDKAVADLLANVGSLIPTILRPVFSSVLGFVGSIFGYLIIPVWAFWILKDRPAIVRSFDRAIPEAWRDDTWATLGIVRRVFGSWIRGQLVLGLVVGVGTFLGLLVLGALVDPVFSRYAVLLAVIAGVFELLPVIGPIISAVPAVLLGATAGLPGIVAALLLYLAVQQIENTILVPKIQGDATNLHPAVVLFSLILGGAIAGLLGAILALPIAATLRDLYVYAFRRAGGMTPAGAATGDARGAHDAGPAGLEPEGARGRNGPGGVSAGEGPSTPEDAPTPG
ncbi:MAG TPA: AI-2E family transporter [Candidatus Nanopelagicales bacterium]|nr:AI-2E family transporter [Candidatus Nanopelagicales bacterium]